MASFALSHVSMVMIYTLAGCRAGFITLNWSAMIGRGLQEAVRWPENPGPEQSSSSCYSLCCYSLCLQLDADGDGDFDFRDIVHKMNGLVGETIQRLVGAKVVKQLDVDGDGDADLMDLLAFAAGNLHGSTGFVLGCTWGLLAGTGKVGLNVTAVRTKLVKVKTYLGGLSRRQKKTPDDTTTGGLASSPKQA